MPEVFPFASKCAGGGPGFSDHTTQLGTKSGTFGVGGASSGLLLDDGKQEGSWHGTKKVRNRHKMRVGCPQVRIYERGYSGCPRFPPVFPRCEIALPVEVAPLLADAYLDSPLLKL